MVRKKPRVMRVRIRHRIVDVEVLLRTYPDDRFLVERIRLRSPSGGAQAQRKDERPIARLVRSFLDGDGAALLKLEPDLRRFTAFQRAVLAAARRIPWGSTVTYAQLAAMAGRPRAIRAVASVMRTNDFPLIIPCHRVVRSDGSIGGFMGRAAGPAVRIKRRLIENEARFA